MKSKHKNYLILGLSVTLIVLAASSIIWLFTNINRSTIQEELVVEDSAESVVEEPLLPSHEEALKQFSFNDPDKVATLQKVATAKYRGDILPHQEEIVKEIEKNKLKIENLGYAYFPSHPMEFTPVVESARQINVPLMLQSDPRWAKLDYGPTDEDNMRLAGCALVSLAMVDAGFNNPQTTPVDILNWSKDDYWVDEAGTSWQIFPDFAKAFNYTYKDHGNDLDSALEAIDRGEIVVASVDPGYITPVGHILVIRGHDPVNKTVYLNDPNDNPKNMFSLQALSEDYLLDEAINYWSFGQKQAS
ncbi:C39 family peptidase [Hutsoniella sourekii]